MFDDPLTDDEATPVACGACGGEFAKPGRVNGLGGGSYAFVACIWCTRGAQSPSQRAAWEAHRARVRAKSGPATVKESGIRRRPEAEPARGATPIGVLRSRRVS